MLYSIVNNKDTKTVTRYNKTFQKNDWPTLTIGYYINYLLSFGENYGPMAQHIARSHSLLYSADQCA